MAMMIPVEGNVSLRVEDTGGSGKPVFFVHGWPLDLQMFEYQFTTLKENGYRCHWVRSSRLWYVSKAMATL